MINTIRKILVLGLILLGRIYHVHSQDITADTTRANQFMDIADSLSRGASYNDAADYYNRAWVLYQEYQLWENYITGLLKEGYAYHQQGNYKQASKILSKGPELAKNLLGEEHLLLGLSYNMLGNVYLVKTDYSKAIEHYARAMKIWKMQLGEDHPKIAVSLSNIGLAWSRLGYYKKAILFHKKSIEIEQKAYGELNAGVAYSNNSLGEVYRQLGSHDSAIYHYNKSLKVRTELFGEKHPYVSGVYNNLGLVYLSQNQLTKAIEHLNKAREIQKEILGPTHPQIGYTLNNLGIAFFESQDYNKSIDYYRQSLRIDSATVGARHTFVAQGLLNISNSLIELGQFDQAFERSKQSLDIHRAIFGTSHPNLVVNYLNLGRIFMLQSKYDSAVHYTKKGLSAHLEGNEKQTYLTIKSYRQLGLIFNLKGDYDRALDNLQTSLSIASKNYSDSKGDYSNPEIGDIIFPIYALEVLLTKGQVLANIGDKKSLEASLSTYQLAIRLLDKVRISYYQDASRKEFTERNINIFSEAQSVAYKLYKITDSINYPNQAFEIAERAKAFVLGQSLKERNALSSFAIPDSLHVVENSLKAEIASAKQDIIERKNQKDGYDTTLVNELESSLFQNERAFEALTKKLEQQYPQYFQLKYSTRTILVEEVQSKLKRENALIEYFWSDTILYTFVITKNDFKIIQRILDSESKILIHDFMAACKDPHVSKNLFISLSSSVNDLILKHAVDKLSDEIQNLTIIADGPLGNLNFDLLLNESIKNKYWKDLPYLFKKYAVHYAYSATLLFDQNRRNIKDLRKPLLAFSFGKTDSKSGNQIALRTFREENQDLPGTRAEIKAISEIVDGDYFYGSYANEKRFKEVAGDYKILHLAIHGEVNDKHSEKSRLNFYAQGDTLEDGRLHIYEIYNLELNAELAVLSACETGTGEIVNGEGVMSLGRAFSYAGVNSLLLTRWEISDAHAPQLMASFYEALNEGMTKSEALRVAKLDFLKNTTESNAYPFLWGSFYILGDDSAIDFEESVPIYYWIIGAVGLLLLGFFLMRRSSWLSRG